MINNLWNIKCNYQYLFIFYKTKLLYNCFNTELCTTYEWIAAKKGLGECGRYTSKSKSR